MKHIFTLLYLALSSLAFSQNFYESPYVSEGRSYRFTIPPGFDQVETGTMEFQMFSSNPNIMIEMSDEENISDFIMIGVTEKGEEGMDHIFDEMLEENQESSGEEIKVSSFVTKSNKEFGTATGKIQFFTDSPIQTMIGITEFDEVLSIVVIVDGNDGNDIDPSLLKALLSSYSEFETDRTNEFTDFSEEFNEVEPSFQNDQFSTELSYDYIDFQPFSQEEDLESEYYWEEDWRSDYTELILAYMYTDDYGSDALAGIKVFSGGSNDYTSGLNKLAALRKVLPGHYIEGIKNEETRITGDSFTFDKYQLESTGYQYDQQVLYTTEFQGETLFLIGYFNTMPSASLEKNLENVVKTLVYETY